MRSESMIACVCIALTCSVVAQEKVIRFEAAEVPAAIGAITKAGGVDVLLVAGVQGKVTATVDPSEPEAALREIARALGIGIAKDEYGVLTLGGAPAQAAPLPKEDKERPPLPDLAGLEIPLAMHEICSRAGVTIAIGPGVEGLVRAQVDASDWRQALRQLAPPGFAVGERHGVVYVVRLPERLRADDPIVFDDVPVTTVLESLGTEAGVKVVVGEGVTGRITLRTSRVPWRHALQIAAEAVGAGVTRGADGSYRVSKSRFGALAPNTVLVPPTAGGAVDQPPTGFYLTGDRMVFETSSEGLPMCVLGNLLGGVLSRRVGADAAVGSDARRIFVTRFHSTKAGLVDLICTCSGIEMVELGSGALELRFRTGG